MVLTDKYTNQQVLGCLMKNPLLLIDHEVQADDFGQNKIAKVIFISILNLFNSGAKALTPMEVDQEVCRCEGISTFYEREKGVEILKESYKIAELENFDYHYTRLKKLALLRVLVKGGYDVSSYYKEEFDTLKEENETIKRFDEANVDTILNEVEGKYNKIRQEFLRGRKEDAQASTGIDELVDNLLASPEVGVPLPGTLYNTAFMGARLGKFYLRSAQSGAGKTRLGVFDACHLCFPERWDFETATFVKEVDEEGRTRAPRKTLIITTELSKDEIQTMMLAFLSGVNEEHILLGKYMWGELERVRYAIRIMKRYKNYFFIDEIPDPNLSNVKMTIKKYATVEKVKYVAYDYIFSSPSLIESLSNVREDVALTMLSTQLKDLAKEYNIYITSSTQVNGEAMNGEGFKNETCLRGSKGIADKIDCGSMVVRVGEKENNDLCMSLKEAGKAPPKRMPNFRFDIYKNRRGRYKSVSIWSFIDLGTGEREDLYITTASGKIVKEFSVFEDETYKKVADEEWLKGGLDTMTTTSTNS